MDLSNPGVLQREGYQSWTLKDARVCRETVTDWRLGVNGLKPNKGEILL